MTEVKNGVYPKVRELSDVLCDIRCKVNMMGSELVNSPDTEIKAECPECLNDDLNNTLIIAKDVNKNLDYILKLLRGDEPSCTFEH